MFRDRVGVEKRWGEKVRYGFTGEGELWWWWVSDIRDGVMLCPFLHHN